MTDMDLWVCLVGYYSGCICVCKTTLVTPDSGCLWLPLTVVVFEESPTFSPGEVGRVGKSIGPRYTIMETLPGCRFQAN